MDELSGGATSQSQVLATLDVKDAFLEVPQPTPLQVKVNNQWFVVLRHLPRQRLGARAWYWFIRQYLTDTMEFEWCAIHPCLARSKDSVILLHVDDVLYVGHQSHCEIFKEKLQQRFAISVSVLGGIGTEVSFLKRKIVHLDDGLALVCGNSISKLVNAFEATFGKVRVSTVTADQGLQMIDSSPLLAAQNASVYRMAVGVCLFLARDRPDVAFAINERPSFVSSPTVNSLKYLKRLVGYLKGTDGYTVVLQGPLGGQGIQYKSNDQFWLLESFSGSDWSRERRHRRSTSSGLHMLRGNFVYASSRTQRVGTQWNIADIGTKVLTSKRLECLLDEIGVKDDGGHSQINAEEHGHAIGHVGNRQMKQAVRTIAGLATLLGLEPIGATGFLHCNPADDPTCDPAPVDDEPHCNLVYVILFVWCAAMTLLGLAAVFMLWRRLRTIEINAGHLELQAAQNDTLIRQHMQAIPRLQQSLDHLREQSTEDNQHMEMLADSVDGIHFGLVRSGGFARAGDDTDPIVEEDDDMGEGGESSDPEDDQLLNPERDLSTRAGELTTTVDDLRAELNQALSAEDWNDAADIQRTILMILDNMHKIME
eukprot:s66_g27.t1